MKRKLTNFEVIWYTITGALIAWGLTYIVLGVIVRFLSTQEGLYQADLAIKNTFGLGFLWWGIIIMWIGVVACLIVLLVKAHGADNKVEKASKRAARLADIQEATSATTNIDK